MCIDNDSAAKAVITIDVYFLNKTLDGNIAPCLDYEFNHFPTSFTLRYFGT